MGKPVRSNVKAAETTNFACGLKIETVKVFNAVIKRKRLPMYIVLETFMEQFCDGRFELEESEILKFEGDMKDTHMVHTMINRSIYLRFKSVCTKRGYRIKSVISAFIEKFLNEKCVLELKSSVNK